MSRVQGHGGELDRVETYRGTTVRIGLSEKVRFEIAVSDEFVEPTIDALCDGGRTGEVGDGKIFVVPLEQVVRIRTGETDNARRDAGRRLMAPGVDAGDTAWMLAATALVLLMTPALGLFYAGPGALQEHAEHVHDVRRRARGGDDHLGADRLLARVL